MEAVSTNDSQNDHDQFTITPEIYDESMSKAEAIVTAIALTSVIIFTVFGNVLVIIAVFTYRPLRSPQNKFFVSLAVADVAVAILVMPLSVVYSIMDQWKFGLAVCKMWLTSDVMCCTASILNLCAIALDRYWAIHDPINYAGKRTLNRVLIMIAVVWALSLLNSAPPLLGWNDWPDEFNDNTPCMLTEEKGYVFFSASTAFFIPLIIMMTVYGKIFMVTKQRIRVKAKAAANLTAGKKTDEEISAIPLESTSTGPVTEDSSTSLTAISPIDSDMKDPTPKDTPDETATENRQPSTLLGRLRNTRLTSTVRKYMRENKKICVLKERRAARVLGIVMGVFVLCWLPFFLMYIIMPFCTECYFSKRMVLFITWLGYVNSSMNPIIYTVFNLDFRRAFYGILCKKK